PEAMVVALVEATRAVGAHPHVSLRNGRIVRALVEGADGDQLETWAGYDLERMKKMDVYIGLRGSANASEMAGLADAQLQAYVGTYQTPVHGEQRVKHTRWCVLRWPSASMAQLAQKSTAEFEDFYFRVCTLDYAKMAAAVVPLQKRMAAADAVHIKGPGDTDLRFSLKGIDAVSCTGSHNIPDGECFSAPVRNSVNGVIHYNTPTVYMGRSFENVRLTFKNGRIEDFTADQGADDLAGIFNTDEGARFVGEFAIGFNPHITHAMRDILFDEKVSGSLHFTPGRCYDEADNGNISDIHWDLVLIQREDFGGGEIWFDDELIRKDGLFVVGDLLDLNPDRLACVE
ncbi:MAG: aminopeptidase, partial [Algisphaera sp.]